MGETETWTCFKRQTSQIRDEYAARSRTAAEADNEEAEVKAVRVSLDPETEINRRGGRHIKEMHHNCFSSVEEHIIHALDQIKHISVTVKRTPTCQPQVHTLNDSTDFQKKINLRCTPSHQ